MTALVLTVALFLGAGAGAARLLRLALPAARVPRVAALFVAGIVANGAAIHLLGLLGVPLARWVFAAVPLLLAAAWLLLPRRPRPGATPVRHPLAATLLLVAAIAATLYPASILPIRDYDGRITWLPKAREIAFDGSLAGPFFQGSAGFNAHNHYPLLLPLAGATVMALSGDLENESARWLYPLVWIAALLVARDLLAKRCPDVAAWTVSALAWLPLLARVEGGTLSAYNDLSLAAFAGIAVLVLAAGDEQGSERTAALLLAGAVLTKNEGLALAVAVIAAAFVSRRVGGWRSAATLVLPVAAAVLMHAAWRMCIPAAYDEQYTVLVRDLPRSLSRLPDALRALAAHAAGRESWGLFWFVVPAMAIATALGRHRRALVLPGIAALLGLAVFAAALSVTSWDTADLARVAADRLLAQLLLPASALVALGGQTLVDRSAGPVG